MWDITYANIRVYDVRNKLKCVLLLSGKWNMLEYQQIYVRCVDILEVTFELEKKNY